MENTDIIVAEKTNIIPSSQSVVPQFEITVEENKRRIDMVREFVKGQMKEGEDYGTIPGVDRPSLLKPGAEKLCNIFGFGVEIQEVDKMENWDKGIFSYTYRAIIRSKRTGLVEAECIGSCNSKESKYSYRWIPDFKASEQEKSQADRTEMRKAKSGQTYQWHRIPNEDIFSQVNTLQKMAQKRAMVGAVLIATRASGFLTQDVEDIVQNEDVSPSPKHRATGQIGGNNAKPHPTTSAQKSFTTSNPKINEMTDLWRKLGAHIGGQDAFDVASVTDFGSKTTDKNIDERIQQLKTKVNVLTDDTIPLETLEY